MKMWIYEDCVCRAAYKSICPNPCPWHDTKDIMNDGKRLRVAAFPASQEENAEGHCQNVTTISDFCDKIKF